jgi:hypothetical protein
MNIVVIVLHRSTYDGKTEAPVECRWHVTVEHFLKAVQEEKEKINHQ